MGANMKTAYLFYKVCLIQDTTRTLELELEVCEISSYPFQIFFSDIEIWFMMVAFIFLIWWSNLLDFRYSLPSEKWKFVLYFCIQYLILISWFWILSSWIVCWLESLEDIHQFRTCSKDHSWISFLVSYFGHCPSFSLGHNGRIGLSLTFNPYYSPPLWSQMFTMLIERQFLSISTFQT